jgi:hypothetical protein
MKALIITKKYSKNGKPLTGFTIIELIITVFILSIAVIGVFSAFSVMVIMTSSISDRLVAGYLAQEGAEIIRNIRDNNWLKMDEDPESYTWDYEIYKCFGSVGCQVDYTTLYLTNPIAPYSNEKYLNIDENNFYSYKDGQETKFKRKITMEYLPNSDYAIKVKVEVFWKEKPSILNPNEDQGVIEIENVLYNWYNQND